MQVLFDLRPPHMVAYQSQKVDISRLLSVVLFLIFILISIFNIGFTTFQYVYVKQELAAARGEQNRVRSMSEGFEAAIVRMREIKAQIVAYLEFTREELPAVEFMKALEDALPIGLKISNMSIRPNNVMMVGAAFSETEIIGFTTNLGAMDYIVTKVDAPLTTRGELNTRVISNFSLTCDIRKILDIAANDPNQQLIRTIGAAAAEEDYPAAEEGGDEQ